MGETYRPLTPADLRLPGDVLPGLLDGWCGPVSMHGGTGWCDASIIDDSGGGDPRVVGYYHGSGGYSVSEYERAAGLRLDCRRPEVRDHARRVLLAGERCRGSTVGLAAGLGCCDGWVQIRSGSGAHADPQPCDACNGSGYLRKPADIGPIIEAELRGDITPTEAAGLVWCSLLRVAAGVKPARAIVSEYMTPKWADRVMFARHIPRDSLCADGGRLVCIVEHDGWYLQPPHDPYSRRNVPHGPETGDAGKSAADTAALAAGYALREPGALLLPLPDGVIGRMEVSDAG